jgi:hypothetical protein
MGSESLILSLNPLSIRQKARPDPEAPHINFNPLSIWQKARPDPKVQIHKRQIKENQLPLAFACFA